MDFPVDLSVISSVKDMNYWTIYTGDLFIVIKVYVKPATFLE